MISYHILNNIACLVHTLFLVLKTSPFHTDEDEKINRLSSEELSVEGPRQNVLIKM